jgi:hypothetical protein
VAVADLPVPRLRVNVGGLGPRVTSGWLAVDPPLSSSQNDLDRAPAERFSKRAAEL